MEILDSVNGKEPGPSADSPQPRCGSRCRVELKRQWVRQAEEEQVEEALNLYQGRHAVDAVRRAGGPEEPPESEKSWRPNPSS